MYHFYCVSYCKIHIVYYRILITMPLGTSNNLLLFGAITIAILDCFSFLCKATTLVPLGMEITR